MAIAACTWIDWTEFHKIWLDASPRIQCKQNVTTWNVRKSVRRHRLIDGIKTIAGWGIGCFPFSLFLAFLSLFFLLTIFTRFCNALRRKNYHETWLICSTRPTAASRFDLFVVPGRDQLNSRTWTFEIMATLFMICWRGSRSQTGFEITFSPGAVYYDVEETVWLYVNPPSDLRHLMAQQINCGVSVRRKQFIYSLNGMHFPHSKTSFGSMFLVYGRTYLTSALDGGECRASWSVAPEQREPDTEGWVGSRAGLEAVARIKISCSSRPLVPYANKYFQVLIWFWKRFHF